jgi:cell division protein FtsQ
LEQIRSGTEKNPWVRAIQIQRIWPDTLVLRIEEHVPFARFGEDRLLSTLGVAYSPGDTRQFEGLPLIDGPANRSTQLFNGFREMQATAQDRGITLETLQVTQGESWTVQSSDGLVMELGRELPIKTFRRFISSLSLLGEQQIRSMVRVDLRYRNGYAVEWKAGTEPEWSSFMKRNDPRQGEAVQRI